MSTDTLDSRVVRKRLLACLMLVALCVAASVATGASASTPTLATAATPLAASFNRETYSYSSALSLSTEANLYQTIVLQSTDASLVPRLHASNPRLRILVYMDVMLSRPGDSLGWSTCTPYSSDNASHPDWFLKDQSGNRIPARSYPGNYLMDVGNPAYQQACITHATAVAKHSGFDGVYLDDLSAWVGWAIPAGVSSPQYPTPTSWQTAMSGLVATAGPQLHSQGLLSVGNIGGSAGTPGLWAKWSAPLDGAEEEFFTDSPSGGRDVYYWPAKLSNAAWSEAHGKLAILHSHGTTELSNTYGIASMLLVGGGAASYSTSNSNYTSAEAWYPEYTTAQQLGAPSGPYSRLPNGVYRRSFANGIVLVNPSGRTVPSFSLGGGLYSGSGLTRARSASMAQTTGLVLLRVG